MLFIACNGQKESLSGDNDVVVEDMEMFRNVIWMMYLVQKIELQRQSSDSSETVRGHIVISLISRDRGSASPRNVEVSDFATALSANDSNELPEGSVSAYLVFR